MIYIIYFKIPQEKNYDKYDKNTNNRPMRWSYGIH